jgi:mono/diheme cytochrome c family protein
VKRLAAALSILAAVGAARAGRADDGSALLAQRCATCHRLAGPAPATLAELWARRGPDLFYAGNKYRAGWLGAWLQKPTRIRPAGEFYADHVRRGEQGDTIDESTLQPHPALNASEAAAATDALMRLKANDERIGAEKVEPGTISKSMGEMSFDKFLGCMACHEIEPGFGGASGPELYTAARRLQPAFIASYIRSPQAWDPKIWMPNKKVNDANIQKLVHYLEVLANEQAHAH